MFGNKRMKQARLQKLATLVEESPQGVTQVDLARGMRVPRSTILRDLACLEAVGVLLAEDTQGRLTLFGRRKK